MLKVYFPGSNKPHSRCFWNSLRSWTWRVGAAQIKDVFFTKFTVQRLSKRRSLTHTPFHYSFINLSRITFTFISRHEAVAIKPRASQKSESADNLLTSHSRKHRLRKCSIAVAFDSRSSLSETLFPGSHPRLLSEEKSLIHLAGSKLLITQRRLLICECIPSPLIPSECCRAAQDSLLSHSVRRGKSSSSAFSFCVTWLFSHHGLMALCTAIHNQF